MLSLNLGSRPLIRLPASAFPSRADLYVCDKCGRDITKHLHPGRAHAWAPMGSERYACSCGQKYLTGATEWDHLGGHGRKRRVRDTFGLGVLFSAMSSIPGLLVYLALHFVFGLRREALVTGLAWIIHDLSGEKRKDALKG
jgi:DNA-directed RNA polymerase subunit RPC12/RpoP